MTESKNTLLRSACWAGAIAMLFAMPGCGGGSSGSAGGTAAVAVAPAPAPTPTPTPTPAPTPTPSPSAPRLVGALPGETLVGPRACARDPVTRDAQGRVTALPSLSAAVIANGLALNYRAIDSYSVEGDFDESGFFFEPDDKRASSNPAYDQFLDPQQGEFFILRNNQFVGSRTFATLGLDNTLGFGNPGGLCFFAVGLPIDTLPAANLDYLATIDGAGRIGGRTVRLFASQGTLRLDSAARTAGIELRLAGRDDPFGDFTAQPARAITVATASLQMNASGAFPLVALTGSNGFSGTIHGQLVSRGSGNASGRGGAGAVFVFELRNAQGEVIFGAVAAEADI